MSAIVSDPMQPTVARRVTVAALSVMATLAPAATGTASRPGELRTERSNPRQFFDPLWDRPIAQSDEIVVQTRVTVSQAKGCSYTRKYCA